MKIEIIDSVSGRQHYSLEQIALLLEDDQIELNYGSQFMGRPGTKIYSGLTDVVKLRSELELNDKRARMWVTHALELEKKLTVCHPKKTWFIVEREDNGCVVGNICPRLTPLHTLFADPDACDNEQKIKLLEALYRAYFYVAGVFDKRLDEGLSNFAVDSENRLYYLDDDIYSWDAFVSFPHILGVLIRNNSWLDESCAEKLGTLLQQLVNEFFKDSHTSTMIASKLRDIYIPDNQKYQLFKIIIGKFQSNKVISRKTQFSDRYLAVFSDVHANLPALTAVLAFLKQENITQGIVMGDTVGYGPHPGACVERLQNSGFEVIKGNHDHAAVTGDIRHGMSTTAKWCIQWTIPYLRQEHLHWLEDLPLELYGTTENEQRWLAIHGAPVDPNYFYGYVYEMTYESNLDVLEKNNIAFCFHGHSHVQGIYARKKTGTQDKFYKEKQQKLQGYRHSLICPGSVGQPRDGVVGAQCAIFDQREQSISFVTLDYDMDKTIKDMQANGFPESLMVRLAKGC